ncbi:AraC-like DNA-binding protein [Streptomyces sp. CZ24]|nr:AraC-like DNA-binding protein [Streptomyces sp. CZ24]
MADRIFTVSEGHGLWMPAGTVHGGRATAGAQFHDAFFAPERTPLGFREPVAITMTPLLESLLTHLARTDLEAAARARAEAVVFDVLQPSEHQFALQLPGDPRIDPIAEALLDDPGDGRSLEEWARQLGTSDRTVTRAFRQATGLSFARWRQLLRAHQALLLLSAGHEGRPSATRSPNRASSASPPAPGWAPPPSSPRACPADARCSSSWRSRRGSPPSR